MARRAKFTAVRPKLLNKAKPFAYRKSSAANDPNDAIIKASKTVILNE